MTLSPFRSFALPLSLFSLPFSLSGIFEFRRFHVTDARRPEERRADARRTGTVFVLDARVSESSRGISSGNLQGPDVVRRHGRLMPRAVVSCPGDRMPIGERRRRQGGRRRGGDVVESQDGLQDAEGSKEDAIGIRNGLRNQMG